MKDSMVWGKLQHFEQKDYRSAIKNIYSCKKFQSCKELG